MSKMIGEIVSREKELTKKECLSNGMSEEYDIQKALGSLPVNRGLREKPIIN